MNVLSHNVPGDLWNPLIQIRLEGEKKQKMKVSVWTSVNSGGEENHTWTKILHEIKWTTNRRVFATQ